ncbi:unnamed protein product [Brachionus calyciflorus]|uniref:Suppressor of forked domain-containing protein n=1 Tax=Brachionus calyciflorus TaxID=104777 RepID=A0A814J826_9BILA|nr:unnamed protein product [Brachionus calyciflorus]
MSITIEKAREKISINPNSLDSWNILIKDAQERPIEEARLFFEQLVTQFPTCGKYWKAYIEEELLHKNFDQVEKLFERCLNNILSIDLWKCFLNYLKESKSHLEDFNKIMIQAYDSAVQKIGLDVMSFSVWLEYLNFLKSLDLNINNQNDKLTLYESVRRIYQMALENPIGNIDQIWKDYCAFETQVNPTNAKNLIDRASREFQNVKKVSKELESVTRPLDRNLPALNLEYPIDEEEDIRQLHAWKRFILWEKQNPLKLADHRAVMRRVIFAYEQSFLCMAYHSDLWHEAACYLINQKESLKQLGTLSDQVILEVTETAAVSLYERAINSFMKNNSLTHLAYTDFEESRGNIKKVYEIFEKYLAQERADQPTLVWIHYIFLVRRNEDIIAARKLFKRARQDSRINYHLFIANALLEYFHTKDKAVGFNIFHLGAKKFSHEPEYMLAFIKYMSHLNEDNNVRVLFERILSTDDIPAYKSNEIWSEFLKFECAVGDLASILKVDKKRLKVFESIQNNPLSDVTQSSLMIDRYKYLDLLPSNSNELKSMGYKNVRGQYNASSQATTMANLSAIFSNNVSISQAELAAVAANELKRSKYPIPDISQMMPFKPVRNILPGMMHSIAGGVFPFPPAVTELVKRLPPPNTYEGPFVIIDELIRKFQESEIVEDFQPLYIHINGEPIREFEHLISGPIISHKRAFANAGSDDEDTKKGKSMDIYKQRQYKKLIQK